MSADKKRADAVTAEAYEQFSSPLLRFCCARLRENKDAADDCVQNAYLVFYKRVLSGEEIMNPKAFLYRTAEMMCRKEDEAFIKHAKHTAGIEELADVPTPEIEPHAADYDYDAIRDILLAELSEEEQRLYQLKYIQRLKLTEIASLLGISPSAAANRTSRLRARIKILIEPVLEEFTRGGQV